ncbi:MAG: hypothetical protein ACOYL6_17680 [Bacteriovoracaceae bacterium]
MIKFFGVLLYLLTISNAIAQHHPHTEHGFILLGSKQLHAYHLAKFNSPHEYQVLFELELRDQRGELLDIAKIKRVHHTELLSMLSEDHFSISDLNSSNPISQFKVKLFKGYLRDRAKRELIFENLTLTILRINYFKKILQTDSGVKGKKLIIVCDSSSGEFFGANLIRGLNDNLKNFEEIVETGPFFFGAAGENSESAILNCSNQIQGAEVDIHIGSKVHANVPFTERYNFFGKIPSLGLWQFYVNKNLVLDISSVNN